MDPMRSLGWLARREISRKKNPLARKGGLALELRIETFFGRSDEMEATATMAIWGALPISAGLIASARSINNGDDNNPNPGWSRLAARN